jgi:transcription-repair coupling factor (superfamily II helicase)
VQKYIGTMIRRPPLSRIGSKKWQQQKDRVTQGIRELAEELLEIQARRIELGGFAFAADTVWQKEFEESFAYQETADQLHAMEQIKADMIRPAPMDRLLCGDVGYGKTELAMRAAFKAVESGKQVAILVPTTVLCVQHGRTFAERFADFPIGIEVLNRFVTDKNAREILRRTREGKVDILIGTHRLLSDDVGFKDLGLLIIDEEQRFGVEHKERLKRFRVNVDVLTMTATPIPRTLHLSMLGLRDISALATAPLDRRSIATRVCLYDPEMIRKAIRFELAREGQLFFVHNRVRSIERADEEIRKIIGDETVRIVIGHGQMHKSELESAMIDFVTGQAQILVCSTIIESGLDIPNANTILINEADRFGLAQLHQLRGRVGRYKHRAFAYMLLPRSRPIHPIAAKRLKAIEEYSQLGAGFRIALRDLEIRGAGNILGAEQSGHIHTIGYELYCQLLQETVQKLRNEPIRKPAAAVIEPGFVPYIPRKYIASDRQRLDVYRRIAMATTAADLGRIGEELKDLFGPAPEAVRMLLEIAELRLAADAKQIRSIMAMPPDIIFQFESGAHVADVFAHSPGSVRIPDPQTVHVRLEKNYFEPRTLLAVLRNILAPMANRERGSRRKKAD